MRNRPKLNVATTVPGVDRTIFRDKHLFWKAATQPNSRFTEEVYSIKLALDLDVSKTGRKRILGLTSALPNEGKSTVTAALALLVARLGARTVLVDLDLRNPVLSRTLASGAKSGVVDIISNRCTLEEVKWADQISGLTFLPGSIKATGGHSGALLASTQMKDLIDELHRQYEYVIVDLPPLTPIMDVRATATLISNYFMVVEWGKTQVDVVERALRSANDVREIMLGVVLNKVEIEKMHKYDVYSKSYYPKNRILACSRLAENRHFQWDDPGSIAHRRSPHR
jgi:polysaccharide biosynthesis transport protein